MINLSLTITEDQCNKDIILLFYENWDKPHKTFKYRLSYIEKMAFLGWNQNT